jgi:tripartite-type tricarboxylate transporter receptor subunit TctC
MIILRRCLSLASLPVLLLPLAAGPAAAQDNFFAGKQVSLIISTGVGGGLDSNARVVARHLGNHLPGKPVIVPKNMPGAGHVRAANYLYNQAPKDGTVIGTLIPSFVLAQVLDGRGIQFDAGKFTWLASTSSSNSTIYFWKATGLTSIDDAFKRQIVMGGTGVGSYTTLYPTIMNNVLGTKFKIIAGYESSAEVGLAMERGEVEGRAGNNFNSLKAENPEWLRAGKIVLAAQVGLERNPDYPNLPLISDFAKNDEQRQILRLFSVDVVIGRPFLAPPGLPAERAAQLRRAFDEMMKDPAFLKEAAEAALDVEPVDGAKIQKIVEQLVGTPPDIVAKAKAAMAPKDVVDQSKGKPGAKPQ